MNRKLLVSVISIGLAAAAARAQRPGGESAKAPRARSRKTAGGASFVSQSVPSAVETEQIFNVAIEMKNSGTDAWDSSYALVPLIRNWNLTDVRLKQGETVEPGATKAFRFTLVAPKKSGAYAFRWQMMRESPKGVFGETSPLVMVNVAASTTGNNARFVSQNLPRTTVKGESYSVTITMKNTGKTTWTAKGGYALELERPEWRPTFEGPDRVELGPSDSIAPGKTKSFSFVVKGSQRKSLFQWRMVQVGREHFGQSTSAVNFHPPSVIGNLDLADCRAIAGWAENVRDPKEHLRVAILADGVQFALATADSVREDLAAAHVGKGDYSFEIVTPKFLLDGKPHSIGAFVIPSGGHQLSQSPMTITCEAPEQPRR